MTLVEHRNTTFTSLGSVHGPTHCLCHFDFSGPIQTVLGPAEYERRFGSRVSLLPSGVNNNLPSTLRSFDFGSLVDGVLARIGQTNHGFECPRRLASTCCTAHPDLALQLPTQPLTIQVYMFARGGSGDDKERKKKGAKGGNFFGFDLKPPPEQQAPKGLRDSVIHELPEGDDSAPADDPAKAEAQQVQMRPRKQSKKEKRLSVAQRVSTIYGFGEDNPLVKTLVARLNLPDTASDEEVAQRVGTIYGFEGADFEALARLIVEGKTFRTSVIERLNVEPDAPAQFLERLEWGGASKGGDASRNSVRASVIQALEIDPSDLDQVKQGALVLGLDLSKVTSKDLAQVGQQEPEEVLGSLAEGGPDAQRAIELFNEQNEQAFKDLVRAKYEVLVRQRELLEETRAKIESMRAAKQDRAPDFEGLCVLRNILIDKVGTSAYGSILFEVFTHTGILLNDGVTLLGNPVFEYLVTDPKFEDTFQRLKRKAIRQRLELIDDESVRIPLSERLARLEEGHKANLEEMLAGQAELQKVSKAQQLKMDAQGVEGFDEEAAKQELARLNAQHEKEAYGLRKAMNMKLYQALCAEINAASQ